MRESIASIAHLCLALLIAPALCADCSSTCKDLQNALPLGSVSYIQPLNFYWAQEQIALVAACYTSPKTTKDVSTVLTTAKKYNCPLAIRGGGHSDVPGASNIQGGVVLSLDAFKEVELDTKSSTVSVGAGCNWGDVYKKLDPSGVTAAGGREESVGVAGLILGGGTSYFSGTRGYGCDNVKSFEREDDLASGQVVRATGDNQYKDLFKALKGGGNNFAVVTRFELDIFEYKSIYGGLSLYTDTPAVTNNITNGFVEVVKNAPSAPNVQLFTSVAYQNGIFLWTSGLQYTLPDPQPAIFRPFRTPILEAARLFTTQRLASHSELATELDQTQPNGFRNQFTTATFANNADLHRRIAAIYREEVQKAVPQMTSLVGFAPGISFQPLTKNFLQKQGRRGGNVLGTEVNEAPLVIVSFLWQWSSTLDDKVVLRGIQNVIDRSSAAAKEKGVFNEFVYMNYAAPKQKPVASYGAGNRAFLKQVSKNYDPEGVFQKLVPGGFKLM